MKDNELSIENELNFCGLSYNTKKRIASSEWNSTMLGKTQGSILKILLSDPGHFITRNRILEQMHKTALEFTDISNALRSHIFRLRGKIEGLYGLKDDIHQDIPVSIEYHKTLGYRLVKTGEPPVSEYKEEILSFVEFTKDKDSSKHFSGLIHDSESKAAYVEYKDNLLARTKLSPTLNMILARLIEEPEGHISYEVFYEMGFETRKQLGDQVKLLRKRLIGLYLFAEKDLSKHPLPKSLRGYGHTFTIKHDFAKKVRS